MSKRFLLTLVVVLLGRTGWTQDLLPSPVASPPAAGNVRITADYLLWWIKNGPVDAPLVTLGSVSDHLTTGTPGAIGSPGTQVLDPTSRLSYGTFSGLRLCVAASVNDLCAIEKGFFFLEQRSTQFSARSGPDGFPILAHPVFLIDDPLTGGSGENRTQVSDPTFPAFSGGTSVTSHTRLSGWDISAAFSGLQQQGIPLVLLGGFRVLDLNEDLQIQDQLTLLDPLAAGFLGQPLAAGSQVSTQDRFRATNHFYGGQLGARSEIRQGIFSLAVQAKVGVGPTQQLATINGSTAVTGPLTATVPGGIYAQTSNIGRYYQSVFSVVPEGQATLGIELTSTIRATVGYTFLYWSNVARPGLQIDRGINPSLVPTDPAYGLGSNLQRPYHVFQTTDFWAQGVSFGLQVSF